MDGSRLSRAYRGYLTGVRKIVLGYIASLEKPQTGEFEKWLP